MTATRAPRRASGPLGARGRAVRLVAALAGLALLTTGTLVGQDDAFPFGPFRMYSTRDDPNGVVRQAVVLDVLRSGATRDVTNTSGAPRRAELEGRLAELRQHPERFGAVARRYPHGADVTAVRLVTREFPLHDGRSGPARDVVIATWYPR